MDELLQRGIQLFNDREFFACHETLETLWVAEVGPRRVFLQSLIHFAVGFYHEQRGNPAGAASQLRKGIQKLAAFLPSTEGPSAEEIDTARLDREIRAALERIEAGKALGGYPLIPLIAPPEINAPDRTS